MNWMNPGSPRACMPSAFSHVRLCATPWTVARQAPLSMGFSRQEYWSGYHSLFQGIFLTQGSNPGLLHCRQILYHLSHQRNPQIQYNLGEITSRSRQLYSGWETVKGNLTQSLENSMHSVNYCWVSKTRQTRFWLKNQICNKESGKCIISGPAEANSIVSPGREDFLGTR